uniref:Uncharacterized protein n=1 Tax=Arundo donax TaxID=35708 RepID=A0A0A9DDI8_ARUDO
MRMPPRPSRTIGGRPWLIRGERRRRRLGRKS